MAKVYLKRFYLEDGGCLDLGTGRECYFKTHRKSHNCGSNDHPYLNISCTNHIFIQVFPENK